MPPSRDLAQGQRGLVLDRESSQAVWPVYTLRQNRTPRSERPKSSPGWSRPRCVCHARYPRAASLRRILQLPRDSSYSTSISPRDSASFSKARKLL